MLFISKWPIKTGEKTDTIDELINFVNVHAKKDVMTIEENLNED